MCVIGKASDAKLQGLLVELSQTKTKDNLSSAKDGDKVRLWQDSQTIDSTSEVKQKKYKELWRDPNLSGPVSPAASAV